MVVKKAWIHRERVVSSPDHILTILETVTILEVEGVRAVTETKEDEVGGAPREKTTPVLK